MRLTLDSQYASMPWEEIDNVIFDVGNVLIEYNPDKLLRDLVPDQPELYPDLKERVFHSPYWPMLDRGVMTSEEAIEPMSALRPDLKPAVTRIMTGWIDLKDVIDEGIDTLKKCKAMGKKLYVLSNYNDQAFAYIRTKYDFWSLFDGFLISGEEGLTKPDPMIFELLIRRFQLDPARSLFIDDSHVNIEGALHCGLQGVCYNRAGKLREFFAL